MCSEEIRGVTQDLSMAPTGGGSNQEYYGGRWFICETIMESAAKRIVEDGFHGEWIGE